VQTIPAEGKVRYKSAESRATGGGEKEGEERTPGSRDPRDEENPRSRVAELLVD